MGRVKSMGWQYVNSGTERVEMDDCERERKVQQTWWLSGSFLHPGHYSTT